MVMQMQELQRASQNQIRTEPINMQSATVSPEVAVVHSGLTASLQVSESQGSEDARNRTSPQEVVVLPISAVDAGLLPSKPGMILANETERFRSVASMILSAMHNSFELSRFLMKCTGKCSSAFGRC
jgi:hypothetical protein